MSHELDFVDELRRRFPVRSPVQTGIGDDGAVIAGGDDSDQTVVVTDMLLDGVHFDLSQTSAELAGRKAVSVNLSDLAAMGCRPTAAFVSVAVPGLAASRSLLASVYDGIEQLAEEFQFTVAGGDTNAWDGPFAINVCMTGVPTGSHAVLRSGAQPSDILAVTGPLGGSLASGRHLTFEPQLEAARQLIEHIQIHAMMDISDGLAIDLHRMMDASGTGAVIDAELIPIHQDVPIALSAAERRHAALTDGEDFELLVAVSADQLSDLRRAGACELTEIGVVTQERGCRISVDGATQPMTVGGWQHD